MGEQSYCATDPLGEGPWSATQQPPRHCKMKSLAQEYVWCLSLDSDLEGRVGQGVPCLDNHNSPTVPLHLWEWPQKLTRWLCRHLFRPRFSFSWRPIPSGLRCTRPTPHSIHNHWGDEKQLHGSWSSWAVSTLTMALPSPVWSLLSLCRTMEWNMSWQPHTTMDEMASPRAQCRPPRQGWRR